VYDDYEKKV